MRSRVHGHSWYGFRPLVIGLHEYISKHFKYHLILMNKIISLGFNRFKILVGLGFLRVE